MIEHIPYDSLYKVNHGWLQSRFHFSFAEYQDSDNINYGPLRVMNDDYIKGNSGFSAHPHKDMEIITYVLEGELTHQDSIGHKESLGRGCVQYMSAGTGIFHSEMNEKDEDIHLIQTWILPQENGLKPNYGSQIFSYEQRHNQWLQIVGPKASNAPIGIYQNASMYVCELDADTRLDFTLSPDKKLYIKLMEGETTINGIHFSGGDAAKLENEDLEIQTLTSSHILLIELQKDIS